MNKTVTLYKLNTPSQKSTVELIISENNLTISGYDIGDTTKEVWGNSDYEYSITTEKSEILKLNLNLTSKPIQTDDDIANWFLSKFSDYRCFSRIRKFFDDQKVVYTTFFWR